MKRIIASSLLAASIAAPAAATELAVVGSWSGLPLHKQYEAPFWSETLPAASGGKITVQLTTHNQMGLGVADVFRLLGDGVYDVAMTVSDYAVADAPELEGLDVPLVALTANEALAMVNAARPMVRDIFRTRFNSEVLAIAPYPPQIVFCNHEVSSLADLKGLKIRGSGRMTTKFLEALGAEGVNVAFSEVPGALQRGVVDCAVTGAGSGYNAGWWEVSTHLVTLPLGGWDPVVTAINLDSWKGLDADTQNLIRERIAEDFETPAWASAQNALVNDVACLTGNGTCPYGDARNMKLVEVSDADFAEARRILEQVVLPDWAGRAGAEWAARWNKTVGKTVGVSVPAN
ncbi:TRAP transporter substrate-binding protein [Futiania mangrovi]|uniref:TRAP transporter substrate-binding protein n=1 Tax=Futiania mangrovi TaxID=2959716 RepID=A0A9J6PNR4_9PROT|nr:TRAP transporter substrate-binding protein [Futiania mangrovii]MCP1337722.1 TRAP transporter substrate-binding protein [Futiania mangrovii]